MLTSSFINKIHKNLKITKFTIRDGYKFCLYPDSIKIMIYNHAGVMNIRFQGTLVCSITSSHIKIHYGNNETYEYKLLQEPDVYFNAQLLGTVQHLTINDFKKIEEIYNHIMAL